MRAGGWHGPARATTGPPQSNHHVNHHRTERGATTELQGATTPVTVAARTRAWCGRSGSLSVTARYLQIVYEDPTPPDVGPQTTAIKSFFGAFHSALFSADFNKIVTWDRVHKNETISMTGPAYTK